MPRKPTKIVQAALRDGDAAIAQEIAVTSAALQRRFGSVPIGPRATLDWAKVLIREQKLQVASGHLAKGSTLAAQLKRLAGGVLEFSKVAAEGVNDIETTDHLDSRVTAHVVAGSLRKRSNREGSMKNVPQEVIQRARDICASENVLWDGLRKKQRKRRIQAVLAQRGDEGAMAKLAARQGKIEERVIAKAAGLRVGEAADPAYLEKLRYTANDLTDPGAAYRAAEALSKLGPPPWVPRSRHRPTRAPWLKPSASSGSGRKSDEPADRMQVPLVRPSRKLVSNVPNASAALRWPREVSWVRSGGGGA